MSACATSSPKRSCPGATDGDPLPSVRAFAAEQGANPLTVAKAYQGFQDEGLIVVRRGVGMFVADGARERLSSSEREQFIRRNGRRSGPAWSGSGSIRPSCWSGTDTEVGSFRARGPPSDRSSRLGQRLDLRPRSAAPYSSSAPASAPAASPSASGTTTDRK
jgi:DNA-binding transcriptional MocR family regulator